MQCPHCMQSMPNVGVLRNHFESKHPKLPIPPQFLES